MILISFIEGGYDVIPTKIHGLLDYAVAIILIALPWILGTHGKNAQTVVPVTLGVLTIIYV